jgi:hypothetical protein
MHRHRADYHGRAERQDASHNAKKAGRPGVEISKLTGAGSSGLDMSRADCQNSKARPRATSHRELDRGTLRSLIKGAGITVEEFVKLL